MAKTKHRPHEDQVETEGHPGAKAAGPAPAVDKNAAEPANKEIGLRSQGDVGKEASTAAAKTGPAAEEGKSVAAEDGPGHLRSQGAVALRKKPDAAGFSNAHMRAETAKKAATSKPEQGKVASAPSVAEKKPDPSKTGVGAEHVAPNEKMKEVKAPTAIAATSDAEVGKTEPVVAGKSEATLENASPTISLKVAVKMDKATLVMNPKSDVRLDDAEAAVAPKSEVKPEKVAPSTSPKVETKDDKATPVMAPKAAVEGAKAAPASAPNVEVKLDKKGSVKPSKPEATADQPAAPEPEAATSGGEAALEGMDLSEAEGEDLQDAAQRAQQTGSLSERRHRRTRERRTHKGTTEEK